MEEPSAAGLSAAHARHRNFDRPERACQRPRAAAVAVARNAGSSFIAGHLASLVTRPCQRSIKLDGRSGTGWPGGGGAAMGFAPGQQASFPLDVVLGYGRAQGATKAAIAALECLGAEPSAAATPRTAMRPLARTPLRGAADHRRHPYAALQAQRTVTIRNKRQWTGRRFTPGVRKTDIKL